MTEAPRLAPPSILMNCATMFNGTDQKVLDRKAQAGIANAARYLTFRRVLLTALVHKEWLFSTRSITQFVSPTLCE